MTAHDRRSVVSLGPLLDRIDQSTERAVALAQELVRSPSENNPPDGDEGPSQLILRDWLAAAGLPCDMFTPDTIEGIQAHRSYRSERNYARRPNLVTTLKGSGGGRSLTLTGHVDTVHRGPEPWSESSPFAGDLINGRLYGRGAYDMKASLAAAAVVLATIKESGIRLRGDLHFGSVVDEERCGGSGTVAMCLKGYRPDAAILMEMTDMVICEATKGAKVYEVTVRGAGAHSSVPQNQSPIDGIARVIQGLRQFERSINSQPAAPPYTGASDPRKVMLGVLRTNGSHNDWDFGTVSQASIRFVLLTLPGQVESSVDAQVQAWMESYWQMDPVLRRFECPIVKSASEYVLPSVTGREGGIVDAVSDAYSVATGTSPKITAADFACDAGILVDDFAIPTVVFGPAGAGAHTADEYVSLDSLRTFMRVIATAAVRWCE